jgi:hypothetical protein
MTGPVACPAQSTRIRTSVGFECVELTFEKSRSHHNSVGSTLTKGFGARGAPDPEGDIAFDVRVCSQFGDCSFRRGGCCRGRHFKRLQFICLALVEIEI